MANIEGNLYVLKLRGLGQKWIVCDPSCTLKKEGPNMCLSPPGKTPLVFLNCMNLSQVQFKTFFLATHLYNKPSLTPAYIFSTS